MASLSPPQLLLVLLILVVPIIPNLWAIRHIYGHDFATPAEKKGWLWLNIFLPVLGGIIYFFTGRRRTVGLSCTVTTEDGASRTDENEPENTQKDGYSS